MLYGLSKGRKTSSNGLLSSTFLILLLSSTAAILSIWARFRHMFAGRSTPQAYLANFYRDLESHRAVERVGRILWDLTLEGSDLLMVRNPFCFSLTPNRDRLSSAWLWRCSILWQDKRYIILIPSVTLAGSTGTFQWILFSRLLPHFLCFQYSPL